MENTTVAVRGGNTINAVCSLSAETKEDKAKLFRIMNNPDKRLSDCINETLEITDVYIEPVQVENQATGEQEIVPRIVLIDKDGTSYQCVSIGIYSALQKIISLFGEPAWKEPIPLKVLNIKKDKKQMLTLDVMF